MTYLLDTAVVGEIRRPHPDPGVLDWFDGVPGGQLYLSVMVLGEIRQGVARLERRDPRQAGVDPVLALPPPS